MEAAQCGDDTRATRGQTRELERSLDGFGTAIAEEETRDTIRRNVRQAFKQLSAHIVIQRFWAGDETLRLSSKSGGNFRASMPQVGNTVSGGAIDVFTPLSVPQQRAATTHNRRGALA